MTIECPECGLKDEVEFESGQQSVFRAPFPAAGGRTKVVCPECGTPFEVGSA